MIHVGQRGNFKLLERFIQNVDRSNPYKILQYYGEKGVIELSKATPVKTGLSSNSWSYEIEKVKNGYRLIWQNSNVSNGIPIVILLQYGHSTKGGAFVEGHDFINPAMAKIFDDLSDNLWKEVSK
jgi:hypothetical protein